MLPESRTWPGITSQRLANSSKTVAAPSRSNCRAWVTGLPLSLDSSAAISSACSRMTWATFHRYLPRSRGVRAFHAKCAS